VTGAGGGIGGAIAQRLAREGAAVACNDLDPATAQATAELVGGVAAPFNVADPAAVAEGTRTIVAGLGPIEILVANHAFMTMAPLLEEHPEDRRRMLEVNLLGTAWLIGAVAAGMRERGWGRIVVIASEWGVTGWPGAASYSASKGGIISLARSAAVALAPHGVAVNAVAPGVTDTPQLDVDAGHAGISHEAMVARYAVDIPLGRIGRVEDVASTVAFLCSESAIALVGQVVQPNGGTTRAR
jgi:NAD(P)-dependent dehydrogenase (short-subunit alcohol dehydrogenase family)